MVDRDQAFAARHKKRKDAFSAESRYDAGRSGCYCKLAAVGREKIIDIKNLNSILQLDSPIRRIQHIQDHLNKPATAERGKEKSMTSELDEAQILTIVKNTVEQYGCELVEIDLENKVLHLKGPEAAKVKCAQALAKVLD